MVMGTTLDTVNLGSVGLVQGRTSIAGSFSAFCSLAGGRQTRRPIDLGGVLYRETLTLVTGGVFAWTRNPMYVGLTLLLVGLAIALASDWTLVLLVPAALVRQNSARPTASIRAMCRATAGGQAKCGFGSVLIWRMRSP